MDNFVPPIRDDAQLTLTDDEQRHLVELDKKLKLVRDHTAKVALGYVNGFHLYGDGGIGKSFTILDELRRMKAHHVLFNSKMTGLGLFTALQKFPDAVHVLEDMEQAFYNADVRGVLRSALWGQRQEGDKGPQERLVTWSSNSMRMEYRSFIFTGGIIVTGNRPMPDIPELNAVKTRLVTMHLHASTNELRALMKSLSLKGYEHDGLVMEPKECMEVCQFVIEQSLALHMSLDMRVLIKAFGNFLQWREAHSYCHWKDMVAAVLRERPTIFRHEVATGSRAERIEQQRRIAAEIMQMTEDRTERCRLWRERTDNLSEQTLYRRMEEARRFGKYMRN